MKNLLEFIVIHLVNHPEDVQITEEPDDRGSVLTIHVHPDDIGRVIGKNGSVIHSIRTICKIRAVKEGTAVRVTIAQPESADAVVATEPTTATNSESEVAAE
jgi:predicted RNA-binding protein YlqC (UPF0109 family)